MVFAWLDPDRAVYPYSTLYGKADTRQSVQQQSAAQMASSQDNAVAAALGALDIPFITEVEIAAVEKGGPADGKLEPGDIVRHRQRQGRHRVDQVTSAIRPLPVGLRGHHDRTTRREARAGTR